MDHGNWRDPQIPTCRKVHAVAKPEWGTKRICLNCGARFYDMMRDPITCPACGATFDPHAQTKARRPRPVAKAVAAVAAARAAPDLELEDAPEVELDDADLVEEDDEDALEVEEDEREEESDSAIEDVSELGDDDMSDVIDTDLEDDEAER
jgi:uncharacterized protein (TIGR02300 family)